MLWRDKSGGDLGYWAIKNDVPTWHRLAGPSTPYSVAGVGDFNGDGTSDILWRDNATGDTGYWAISNDIPTWHRLAASSTAYSVAGVGDFNGDGISDVLWRDKSGGDLGYWAISNNTATWHRLAGSSTAYDVVGIGDFNGDGTSDILWRDKSGGDTGYWAINDDLPTWHRLAAATQTTLATILTDPGSAAGCTTIFVPTGDATLTADPTTPTVFDFADIAFGNDTIAGFDPTRDTIGLPKTLAADFTAVQNETSSTAGGSLITLNPSQSILITDTAPASLAAANFRFV